MSEAKHILAGRGKKINLLSVTANCMTLTYDSMPRLSTPLCVYFFVVASLCELHTIIVLLHIFLIIF